MKGLIYCIKELSTGEILYVGSTTMLLCERKGAHLTMCFAKLRNSPLYVYIREKCDSRKHFKDIFSFYIIKEVDTDSREELRKIERSVIEELKPRLNTNRAYRSKDDLKNDNKELNMKWRKEHPKEHCERVMKWQKAHYESYREYQREYQREYYHRKKENNFPAGCI